MGKKSKTKGNGFELVIANRLKDHFLGDLDRDTKHNLIHRTPMSGGHVEKGDIIIKPPVLGVFPWFIECRNREVWNWKQIWEKGEESVILTWFLEDAHGKCHDYDNMPLPENKRWPLLVFTRNFRRNYFACLEEDAKYVLQYEGMDSEEVFGTLMRLWVDTEYVKGYVIIGDFEEFLKQHNDDELIEFRMSLGGAY